MTINALSRALRLVVAVVLLTGCDTATDPAIGTAGLGPFEGLWNDRTWNGRGYVVLLRDTLYITGHHRPVANQFYDEQVSVKVPFAGVGMYELTGSQGEMWEITGGDAGYFAATPGDLVITRVDDGAMQIEGRLDLRGSAFGRSWSFTAAEFKLPIYSSFNDTPRLY